MTNQDEILPRELASRVARRGKWTPEEERYTEKIICKWWWYIYLYIYINYLIYILWSSFIIVDFENGTLDVPGNVLSL